MGKRGPKKGWKDALKNKPEKPAESFLGDDKPPEQEKPDSPPPPEETPSAADLQRRVSALEEKLGLMENIIKGDLGKVGLRLKAQADRLERLEALAKQIEDALKGKKRPGFLDWVS